MRLAFCEALHFGSVRRHRSLETLLMRRHRILEAFGTPIRAGGRAQDEPGEGEANRDDGEEFGGDIHTGERSTPRAAGGDPSG